MEYTNIISMFIAPVVSVVIVVAIMLIKGPKKSKLFSIYLGVIGSIFLVIGVWGFIAKDWQITTVEAAVDIVFILFGVTCFLGTHIHAEIYLLKKKLAEIGRKR